MYAALVNFNDRPGPSAALTGRARTLRCARAFLQKGGALSGDIGSAQKRDSRPAPARRAAPRRASALRWVCAMAPHCPRKRTACIGDAPTRQRGEALKGGSGA